MPKKATIVKLDSQESHNWLLLIPHHLPCTYPSSAFQLRRKKIFWF